MIGKRAKIKEIDSYCRFLWGVEGTIELVNKELFLRFDTPRFRGENGLGSNTGGGWSMDGCHLTKNSFELI